MEYNESMRKAIVFLLLIAGLWGSNEPLEAKDSDLEKATLAAGCFWGVEKIFSEYPGVVSTQVGYTGGKKANPSYHEVCETDTGHAEAIEVSFDPSKISYNDLLIHFFSYHDPTTPNRQGPDVGSQYRSAVFYHTPEQKEIAEAAVAKLQAAKVFRDPIVTEIVPAGAFYRAEEYHQKYLKKNPFGYCSIHFQSKKIAEALKVKS